MKKVLIIILLGVLVYGGARGYSWYEGVESLKQDAYSILEEYNILKIQNREYEDEREVLAEEQSRSREFVKQEAGNFSEFEYCSRYLDLVAPLDLE